MKKLLVGLFVLGSIAFGCDKSAEVLISTGTKVGNEGFEILKNGINNNDRDSLKEGFGKVFASTLYYSHVLEEHGKEITDEDAKKIQDEIDRLEKIGALTIKLMSK